MADLVAQFEQYRRVQIAELRPYVPGERLDPISISEVDRAAGSPKLGDMIARNPKNHADQWLVAAAYFAENFEPVVSQEKETPVAARELIEDAEDAADDLIYSAQYLQEALEAGEGVYESKWLGGVMRAHEMLLNLSKHIEHADAWPCDGAGDESGNFVCKHLATPIAVPPEREGWQMVPKEPTEEMLNAGYDWDDHVTGTETHPRNRGLYRAMLSSAPEQKT